MTLAAALDTLHRIAASPDLAAARVDRGPALVNRVAVLPASFNPPTLAHLELLGEAREVDGVGATALLLTTRNVDKGLYGAGFDDRLGMLLALQDRALGVLVANAARIPDQGRALSDTFPDLGFDFVVGYDTLVRLFDPRYYNDHADMHGTLAAFFESHRVIAANRGQHDVDVVETYLDSNADASRYRSRIAVRRVRDAAARMSSSHVREHLSRAGGSPDLPIEVARYIERHGLYRDRS